MKKIDINKIVDGITKNIINDVSSSLTSETLSREIDKENKNIEQIKQNNNIIQVEANKQINTNILTIPQLNKTSFLTKKHLISKKGHKKTLIETNNITKDLLKDKEINTSQNLPNITKIEDKPPFQPKKFDVAAIGKNLYIFTDVSFSPEIHKYVVPNPLDDNRKKLVLDPLKAMTGKFWSLKNPTEKEKPIFVSHYINDKESFKINYHDIVEHHEEQSDFGRTANIISIEPNKEHFKTADLEYSKTLLKSSIKGEHYKGSTKFEENIDKPLSPIIREKVLFHDYTFEMALPFSDEELKRYNHLEGSLNADITSLYQFFIEDYETNINQKNVFENVLPNIYVLISENSEETSNPIFKKFISLDGTIKTDTKKLIKTNINKTSKKNLHKSNVFDLKENAIGEYFDLFGREFKNVPKNTVESLDKKFSNIILSYKDIDLIQKFNDKVDLFPMAVEIKFSTDKTAQFCQILKDTDLFDLFISQISNKVINKTFQELKVKEIREIIVDPVGDGNTHKDLSNKTEILKTLDLANLIVDIKDNINGLKEENSVYLGTFEKTKLNQDRPEYKFIRSLNLEIFQTKFQTLLKDNLRTYQDINNGEKCYNETVCYRIAKFKRFV